MEETRPWTRWQDWVAVIAGAYLALSPLWVEVDTVGIWTMAVVGGVAALAGLLNLAMPAISFIDEWVAAAIGAIAFVAPWLFQYSDQSAASWTSWIVGAVLAIVALWALPASMELHRHQPTGA